MTIEPSRFNVPKKNKFGWSIRLHASSLLLCCFRSDSFAFHKLVTSKPLLFPCSRIRIVPVCGTSAVHEGAFFSRRRHTTYHREKEKRSIFSTTHSTNKQSTLSVSTVRVVVESLLLLLLLLLSSLPPPSLSLVEHRSFSIVAVHRPSSSITYTHSFLCW